MLGQQVSKFMDDRLSDAITPYRAKNSCETTLIRLTETWRAELDSKKIVGILSSDMSKALNFVSLSPQLLINNLQAYKFSDQVIKLIRSYFQGREKRVRIGSVTSDWLLVVVKRGCPQGSTLTFGPGGTAPRPTRYPFIYHFWQKKYPFSLEFASLLIAVNALSFQWLNHKTRTFPRRFHSHKMRLLALLGILRTELTDFPTLSYTSTSEIPTLSYTQA